MIFKFRKVDKVRGGRGWGVKRLSIKSRLLPGTKFKKRKEKKVHMILNIHNARKLSHSGFIWCQYFLICQFAIGVFLLASQGCFATPFRAETLFLMAGWS